MAIELRRADPSFEGLKAEAKRELEQEIRLEAARDRSAKLRQENGADSLYLLSEDENPNLQLETTQLRNQIAAGLEQPRRYKPEEPIAKSPYAKEPLWERELRAGLKDAMREEVKRSMQSEAKQELQEYAEREIAYRSARLKRQALQEELRMRMEKQIQMEERYQNYGECRPRRVGSAPHSGSGPFESVRWEACQRPQATLSRFG